MSASPSDILESQAFHDNKTTTACHKCGTAIDVEQDHYGVSMNGEEYICTSCATDAALMRAIESKYGDEPAKYFACARYQDEEVTTASYWSRTAAFKRAAELAEFTWDVKSYIEEG